MRAPAAALLAVALAAPWVASGAASPVAAGAPIAGPAATPEAGLVAPGCRWERVVGGGLTLRSQACDLATGRWRVVWDPRRRGFELRVDGRAHSLVVQPWPLATAGEPEGVVAALKRAGHLPAASTCRIEPATVRPLPPSASAFVLAPAEPAPAMTPSGEIPEQPCGAYGTSTHGVRYFVLDARRPGRIVFVDEGQDQPMFDPASVIGR